jgi:CBS domain-containing protein
MRVRDLIDTKSDTVVTVQAKDDLSTAIHLLMRHNIGGLPVLANDGSVVGILAERDVVRALYYKPSAFAALRVQDVMRPPPTCDADDSIADAMLRMTEQRQRHFLVLDEGKLVGVLSVGDLLKDRLRQLETEAGVLRDYLAAQRAAH